MATPPNRSKLTPCRPMRGMVLVMVLWLIAGLSLVLGATLRAVRLEVVAVGQNQANSIGSNLADAAIRLKLQELFAAKRLSFNSIENSTVEYAGKHIDVNVVPLNGLIDLNAAPVGLLTDLFQFGAGMSQSSASQIAASVLEFRGRKDSFGAQIKMQSREDLLQIPGMRYQEYAKLKDCVTVEIVGGGRVNPLAATLEVLTVLARGDGAFAARVLETRPIAKETVDTTKLSSNFIALEQTSFVAISARLALEDNIVLNRTWKVNLRTPAHGLNWRTLAMETSTLHINSTN